ncbi:MAG: hypothetical protein EU541_05540 [Promethearchaeota archaeon]|nr:MAG: hypothetical protein EU541_05540 [Candidatus Lokiarchaeota archaeon]
MSFEFTLFQLIGAIGIILISIGIVIQERLKQDFFYIWGGICLELYSISIGDLIFIILQIIFTIAAVFDFVKVLAKKRKSGNFKVI